MIALAFAAGFAARWVGLPPLIGFLAAGFMLNGLGLESGPALQLIADLGVTLLLFTIGLKLDIRSLLRAEIWGAASLNMVASTMALMAVLAAAKFAGLAMMTDLDATGLLVLGFALSFSSTVFAIKVLEDRSELTSLYGVVAIGILIMQDLFAVVFLAASSGEPPSPWALSLILLWPAARVMRMLLTRVGHGELQVLYGTFLSLVVGYSLFEAVGLKGDLGALIIGMLLASHASTAGLAKSLFHLKELFLVGFFLNIGLGAMPDVSMVIMALLLVAVLPLKSALYFFILMRFKLRTRTGLLATLSLTNYSEFGLIVAAIAISAGWLPEDWLVVISLALATSFVAASALNSASEWLYTTLRDRLKRFESAELMTADQPITLEGVDAVVLGMGRIGSGAYQRLSEKHGYRVLGIDNSPAKLALHKKAGHRVIEGDAVDSDFWDKLVIADRVQLILLAMPQHSGNLYALTRLKHRNFSGRIAAIVQYQDEIEPLRALGANAVFHIYEEAGSAFADDAVADLLALKPASSSAPSRLG